jgi:CRP-like cAMP-binding protein
MLLLATLTTGDFFGERCILRDANEPADCSVRSVEYSDLLKLSRTTFEDLQSDMRDSDYNMFCYKLREVMETRDKETESARLKATRTKLGKAGKGVLAKLNVIHRIVSSRRATLAGGTNKAGSVQPMQIMMRMASQNRDRGTMVSEGPFASPPPPEEKADVDSYPPETQMKAVGEGVEEGFSTKSSMSSGGVT